MSKKSKRYYGRMARKALSLSLAVAVTSSSLYQDSMLAYAAVETSNSWKKDVTAATDALSNALQVQDTYQEAVEAVETAIDTLEGAQTVEGLAVTEIGKDYIVLEWVPFSSDTLVGYNVYWSDKNEETSAYALLGGDGYAALSESEMTIDVSKLDPTSEVVTFTVYKPTTQNYFFKVAPVTTVGVGSKCEPVMSPTAVSYDAYLEGIDRGMTATMTSAGVMLNWRLMADEVSGYSDTGLTGVNFNIYRDGILLATVEDSTTYLDAENTSNLTAETYMIVPVSYETGEELTDQACKAYDIFTADSANANVSYIDIPLQTPASTTFRETYGIDTMALGGYTMTDSGYTNVDATITYSANDASVADVDGDGKYEYIVKWDPSYSKDVSQQGYTGKQYIDCYELDGTLLWRLDLGVNIRSGAHYTEFGVFDYDGDNKAEMVVKTAPGTKMTRYELDENGKNVTDANGNLVVASSDYVNISEEDKAAGVTDTSSFVCSADDYREYLIDVFEDWGIWSRYSEKTRTDAIAGHWSGNLVELFSVSADYSDATFYTGEVKSSANVTFGVGSMTTEDIQTYIPEYQEGDRLVNVCLRDENGNIQYVSSSSGVNPVMKTVRVADVKNYYGGYDLESVNFDATEVGYTEEQATILADYFLKHYEYRMKKHSLEVYEGYIITGPEYVTLFDCATGAELDTQDFHYGREDDGMLWGDYAMNYIEPGNRNDRYNVAVAYLDGETPSAIMGRGYYTRTTMAAYNVVDKKLQLAACIDSGWTVMSNPFNDGPHGMDGCDEENGTLSGQGDHYIAVADIDGDGCQDLINGGAIVSYKNGKMYLYSSGGDYLNGGTGETWAKFGHGDAIHITDIDPDNPGLEIVSCFEGAAWAPYNWAMRDAETNTVLFGAPGTSDYGRIMIGDVLPDVRGLEIDAGYDSKGNSVKLTGTSNNMNIKWSPDMTTQFVTGTTTASIIGNVDGKSYTFLKADGFATNNSTKGNPALVADLFGDYREEMILRDTASSKLRIYMNTEVSEHKNYTLMQNLQYRVGVASQNSAYNQPAYTDYYYASDTDWKYVTTPNKPSDQEPGKVIVYPANVTLNVTNKTLLSGETLALSAKVTPSSATQDVTWSVDDESVATVDENGVVTAVGKGSCYVTATTINDKTSTCKISVIGDYVVDGLDQFAVGETKTFTFGQGATMNASTIYSQETGYGWMQPANITLTDGDGYVAGTNYRTADTTNTAYEYPTFLMDVPVGIYEVTIVQGTNGTDAAVNGAYVEGNMYSVRWSTEGFSVSFTEPSEGSYIWTAAGETKSSTVQTAVADGQLTVNLATWLKDDGTSGQTYVKEISVKRLAQETAHSSAPTLRFIGDSTLAKYPPEDGGTWTEIPERTGWGEDFSMGKFVDDSVVLVNKAVAGSSLTSYIYDGYYNDFFMNSRPGDTVIIESGINDSAAGRRYSDATQFETRLRYLIDSCQAFGLDVIISSGTSSSTTYTAKMEALATEYGLPYVDLLGKWNAYLSTIGAGSGDVTVDGTHLNRVGGVVAAQIVANEIAGLEGIYISGHVNAIPVNYNAPTAKVTGVYAKAQTENSITLAWNIAEDSLYEYDQLITDFNVYRKLKGSSDDYKLVATQTAYVSAGMNGPQMQTTIESPETGTYMYYVTCQGLAGEGPASSIVNIAEFEPTTAYTLLSLIDAYESQLYDASTYTVESYAALQVALEKAKALLKDASATEESLTEALNAVTAAKDGLQLNVVEVERNNFQTEELKTAPWGAGGNQSGLLSCVMEEDGNRLLKLYVEAAGQRYVNKTFSNVSDINATTEMIEFVWYPGQPDTRNCTEMEFYTSDANRILSLKTSNNGHIGYVTGNYPSDNSYLIGDGFHAYEGSTAVDLGLTNEAWYHVKLVFHYDTNKADLYIEAVDDSLESKVVKDIAIDAAGTNSVTKLNFLLKRGRTDGDAGNDLSILWNTYIDDFGMFYATESNTVDTTAYEAALATYEAAIKGLNSTVLASEKFVLANAIVDIMEKDAGFYTTADYAYATSVLTEATTVAPQVTPTSEVTLQVEAETMTAGLTQAITATLSEGANEELIWTSSDESIISVEGDATTATVLAKAAGTATITATGAASGVTGSIAVTVTGKAYFFGSDVTADAAYNEETGYGFHNYTYPTAATGWVNDVYYARELSKTVGNAYVDGANSTSEYLAVNGQVWTELPENSTREEDTITYENTNSFDVDMENGEYTVSVTFYNPTNTAMDVMVKAEDIRRYDYGDHETAQIAQASVGAGQTVAVDFDLALTDGQLTLRFEQNDLGKSYETAATRTVYVKSVSIDAYQKAARDKTAVYVMGDSTVQTYTNTDTYRMGWGQQLYSLFGTLNQETLNETSTGYAYYETEDVVVMNYARDGRSAKSALEEGRLNEVLLGVQEGDYVFAQFAHNDDNQARCNRFLNIADYKKYLRNYADAIAERGATLVLVTPIVLNVWEENGALDHRFDDYRLAMMEVAAEKDLPLLDLMGSSHELVSAMGATNVNALVMYMSDTVHTKTAGAMLYTGLLNNLLQREDNQKLDALKALMNTAKTEENATMECETLLYVGDTGALSVAGADDMHVYSSDESVVKIVGGKLSAVGAGTAIITAGYTTGDLATTDCTAYTTYAIVTVTDDASVFAPEDGNLTASTEVVTQMTYLAGAPSQEVHELQAAADVSASFLDSIINWFKSVWRAIVNFFTGGNLGETDDQAKADPIERETQSVEESKVEETKVEETKIEESTVIVTEVESVQPETTVEATTEESSEKQSEVNKPVRPITPVKPPVQEESAEEESAETAETAVIEESMVPTTATPTPSTPATSQPAASQPSGGNSGSNNDNKEESSSQAPTSAPSTEESSTVEPSTEEPSTEESSTVEPSTEEPSTEEPSTEESSTVEPSTEEPSTEEPSTEEPSTEPSEGDTSYNEANWNNLKNALASLKVKMSTFSEESTPFDYDGVLVNKMLTVIDAITKVQGTDVVDMTEGKTVYAEAQAAMEAKVLYTESSIAKLEEAMAAYDAAVNALDISTALADVKEVLAYWLQGVDTEAAKNAYSLYVDFASIQTGGSAFNADLEYLTEGWTSVGYKDGYPYYTGYSKELGYGLIEGSNGRHRNTGNTLLDDFILGGTFNMDLPAGEYKVTVYTGDLMSGCKGASYYVFYTDYAKDADGNITGNIIAGDTTKYTSSTASYMTTDFTFKLEEAATVTMVASGHTNAMIVEQQVALNVEAFDVTELQNLVTSIDEKNLVETDYTISTWEAFEAAYKEAVAAIAAGASYYQQQASIYANLENAYKALAQRVATKEYAIDFGPADEDGADAKLWTADALLSSFYTMENKTVEMGLGNMLYDTNMDDNGMHFGFTQEVASGYTATGGNYFRDWVYAAGGNAYTFKADVPVGDYYVYVYTGCKEAANTAKFYFGNGDAALETTNTAVATDAEGRTVYTQTSSAGGQFVAPTCIYKVSVAEDANALGYVKDTKIGTFSITLFNDDTALAEDEITARLCGIELCPAPVAEEEEEEVKEVITIPDTAERIYSFDFGTRNTAADFIVMGTESYDAAKGYGYLTDAAAITPARVGLDMSAYTCEDANLLTAASDMAFADSTLEFQVDLKAGTYYFTVYASAGYFNGTYATNTVYVKVNGGEYALIGTPAYAGTDLSELAMIYKLELAEASSVVFKADNEGKRAFFNAILIDGEGIAEDAVATEPVETVENEMLLLDEEGNVVAVTDVDFAEFTNWKSGAYTEEAAFAEKANAMCLNGYVTAEAGKTYYAAIGSEDYSLTVTQLDEAYAVVASDTVIDKESFTVAENAKYLAITLNTVDEAATYETYQTLFEGDFTIGISTEAPVEEEEVTEAETEGLEETTEEGTTEVEEATTEVTTEEGTTEVEEATTEVTTEEATTEVEEATTEVATEEGATEVEEATTEDASKEETTSTVESESVVEPTTEATSEVTTVTESSAEESSAPAETVSEIETIQVEETAQAS